MRRLRFGALLAVLLLQGAHGTGTPLAVNGTLEVANTTTLNSTLAVIGATTLNSTLAVIGATTLNNTLAVTGATTLNSTLAVVGATTLNNTLSVMGATTLANSLTVANGAFTVDASGKLSLDNINVGLVNFTAGTAGGSTLTGLSNANVLTLDRVRNATAFNGNPNTSAASVFVAQQLQAEIALLTPPPSPPPLPPRPPSPPAATNFDYQGSSKPCAPYVLAAGEASYCADNTSALLVIPLPVGSIFTVAAVWPISAKRSYSGAINAWCSNGSSVRVSIMNASNLTALDTSVNDDQLDESVIYDNTTHCLGNLIAWRNDIAAVNVSLLQKCGEHAPCNGRIAYQLQMPFPPPPPPSPPPPNPPAWVAEPMSPRKAVWIFNNSVPFSTFSVSMPVNEFDLVAAGTCGLNGSACSGDTVVSIYAPPSSTLSPVTNSYSSTPGGLFAVSDDGFSPFPSSTCSLCSFVAPQSYTDASGNVTVTVSCFGAGVCWGVLVVQAYSAMPAPSGLATGTEAPLAQEVSGGVGYAQFSCGAFSLASSDKYVSWTNDTAECRVLVPPLATLYVDNCGPGESPTSSAPPAFPNLGGYCYGNATYLELIDAGSGKMLMSSSDVGTLGTVPSGCATLADEGCAYVSGWVNGDNRTTEVVIRQSCAASGLESCRGLSVAQVTFPAPTPTPPSPPPAPLPPLSNSSAAGGLTPFSLSTSLPALTREQVVTLAPNASIVLGTCNVTALNASTPARLASGTFCTAGTSLTVTVTGYGLAVRTFGDSGPEVPGCGGCSYVGPWTNPNSVAVNLSATVSCTDASRPCAGAFGFVVVPSPSPPPAPPPPSPPPPSPAPLGTQNAGFSLPNVSAPVPTMAQFIYPGALLRNASYRVSAGTCNLFNAFCTGDTVVSLFSITGGSSVALLASNDNGPPFNAPFAACGVCSYVAPFVLTTSAVADTSLRLRVACLGSCTGVAAYSVTAA